MIRTGEINLLNYPPFERFIPQPENEEIENGLGYRHAIRVETSDLLKIDKLDYKDILEFQIRRGWESLYKDAWNHLTRLSIGKDCYFVSKIIPSMREAGSASWGFGIVLQVDLEITVSPTKEFIIPEFIYSHEFEGNTVSSPKAVEWRCGYCGTPQPMEHRKCDSCGANRALLIQEM